MTKFEHKFSSVIDDLLVVDDFLLDFWDVKVFVKPCEDLAKFIGGCNVLELDLVVPSEHNNNCNKVGMITGVEAAAAEPHPLKLDESHPDPFESTPICIIANGLGWPFSSFKHSDKPFLANYVLPTPGGPSNPKQ